MTKTELALPTHGDSSTWTEQEKALVKAAGLVRSEGRGNAAKEFLADRPTVEAFLAHCRRTGLDPIARQIYAIYRGGKWGIQISIDGARLVAERTGKYRGQTPTQWTDGTIVQVPLREDGKIVRDGSGNPIMVDDYRWLDTWLSAEYPKAARVGILHADFAEPLWAVANWDSYVVTKDEWVANEKTGNVVVSDMWKKFGPLMLGKCAEMLGLRKAFPQDLSGLYSTEEMAQAEKQAGPPSRPSSPSAPPSVASEPDDRDWGAEIAAVESIETLTALYSEAQAVGAFAVLVGDGDDEKTVEAALWARKAEIEKAAQTIVDVEPEPDVPRDWLNEAKALKTSAQVIALYREAMALDADEKTLEALTSLAAEKDTAEKQVPPAGEWAKGAGQPDDWDEGRAAVLADTAATDEPSDPDEGTK